MFKIILFYFKLIFNSSANANSKSEFALAGWCLIQKKSYRIFSQSSITFFYIFICWGRAIRRLFSATTNHRKIEGGNPKYALWDNSATRIENRVNHIKTNGGELPSLFVVRNETGPNKFIVKIWIAFLFICLLPCLFVWSLFNKHPENIGLLFDEWIEAYGLLDAIDKYKINYLYFYCPYENDANALYLFLRERGVTMNKIPSPNLLAIHNADILTDILTLTSPCQLDELLRLSDKIKYSKVIKWSPEQFHVYCDLYKERKVVPKFTIGFYSHGSWVRQLKINGGAVYNDIEAELSLVNVLFGIFSKNNNFKISIFLHPNERQFEDFNVVISYYDKLFGQGNYSISDLSQSSSTKFDSVDIGIGAFSTILFERLFMGFKTVFYPIGINYFPQKEANIAAICPVTPENLESLILHLSEISTLEYLQEYNLGKYTISNWNSGLNHDKKN